MLKKPLRLKTFLFLLLLSTAGIGIAWAQPTVQSSNLTFGPIDTNSIEVNWTRGNGGFVIVLAREGGAVNANPVDGSVYAANNSFTAGDQIGSGNYVVYIGTGTSVVVNGLTPNTTYHFAAYEFDTGGAPDPAYLVTSPATNSETTDCEPPTDQVTCASFSAVQDNQMTINWT